MFNNNNFFFFRFVESTFSGNPLSEKKLSEWRRGVNAEPGFCMDRFLVAQAKSKELSDRGLNLYVNLTIDEMKLHKHISFNRKQFAGKKKIFFCVIPSNQNF